MHIILVMVSIFINILLLNNNRYSIANDSVNLHEMELNFRSKEELNNVQIDDKVIGCTNAPHTIINYSSMSCPHCAEFMTKDFNLLKEKFIDTCKVRFVYREIPNNSAALMTASIAHCFYIRHNNINTYFDIIKIFFRTQRSWAMRYDPESVKEIMLLNGYNKEDIDYCLGNKTYINYIIEHGYEYQKVMDIRFTPLSVIDGNVMSQNISYDDINAIISKTAVKGAK
ncbi:thioredoxin domain-containing protein [Lyticum sinuosum]|nr:thioredoxin domain-containing protein [Lyticum sinuosum]